MAAPFVLKFSGVVEEGDTGWLADRGGVTSETTIITPIQQYALPIATLAQSWSVMLLDLLPLLSDSITFRLYKNASIVTSQTITGPFSPLSPSVVNFGPVAYGSSDRIGVEIVGIGTFGVMPVSVMVSFHP